MKTIKTITSLSLSAAVLLGASGCSDFISLKDQSSTATAVESSVPAATSIETGSSSYKPTPLVTPAPVRSMTAEEKKREPVRISAERTVNRIKALGKSREYQWYLKDHDAAYSKVQSEETAWKEIISKNPKIMADVDEVMGMDNNKYGKIETYGDLTPETARTRIVMEQFYYIHEQISQYEQEYPELTLSISPEGIVEEDGKLRIALGGVSVKDSSGVKVGSIYAFDSLFVEEKGNRFTI